MYSEDDSKHAGSLNFCQAVPVVQQTLSSISPVNWRSLDCGNMSLGSLQFSVVVTPLQGGIDFAFQFIWYICMELQRVCQTKFFRPERVELIVLTISARFFAFSLDRTHREWYTQRCQATLRYGKDDSLAGMFETLANTYQLDAVLQALEDDLIDVAGSQCHDRTHLPKGGKYGSTTNYMMLQNIVIIGTVTLVGLVVSLIFNRRLRSFQHAIERVTSGLDVQESLLAEQRSTLTQIADSLQNITVNNHETLKGLDMLAEERHLLRTLIDALPDLIYIKDMNHRFVLVNAALVQYLNLTNADELIGKSDFDLLEAELANRYYQDERAVLDGEPLLERIEPGIDRKTGSTRWFFSTKVPFHDYQGQVKGILGISRDITKRKEAEDALQSLNNRLEQRLQRHV